MMFKNNGESCKIRIGNKDKCDWKTIKHGEVVDLEKSVGLRNKFEEVKTTEGQINDQVVETKQIEDVVDTSDDLFFKELKSINGIGKKTAEDLVSWGTKEKLIEYISEGKKIPCRDDVEQKLREKYGRSIN